MTTSAQEAVPVDELTGALLLLQPKLDRALPVSERAQNFWKVVVAVRDLASADILRQDLTEFADRCGLTRDLGRKGVEDVQHLISWGLLNRWPFARRKGRA